MDYLLEHHGTALLLAVLLAPFALGLPSLVAMVRGIPDARRVMALNAMGLVFFSAWFGALAWAWAGRRDVSYYDLVMRRKWRYLGVAGAFAGIFVVLGGYFAGSSVSAAMGMGKGPTYRQAAVTSGPISVDVAASGRVRPVKIVQVAAQTSGAVLSVAVDVNDVVHEGDVVARMDPASYEARVRLAEAQLARARAAIADASAAGIRARANSAVSVANAARKAALFDRGFVTRADLEAAVGGVAEGRAQVGQSRASRDAAMAMVAQAESELRAARLDLDRTVVRSPVTGTVLVRRVEPGQTVVSSFQTTTLFEIAEDLSRMRVEAQVDEADVGRIRVGQAASFTVESFPDEPFRGRVVTIRKSPEEVQGAVLYPVWLEVLGSSRRLMSGMTADVRIAEASRSEALRVPVAALSFVPDGDAGSGGDRLFVLVDGRPRAVPVRVGLRGDRWAELLGSRLRPGDRVIVGADERTG